MFIDIARAAETVHAVTTNVTEAAHNATAAEEGIMASLGLNPSLFIAQLVNFIVVAIIIWFLILKPLTQKLSERQETIEKSLKNAEEVEENLRKSEKSYQNKIDEAKSEAAQIITKSQQEAVNIGERLKDKTKSEIELLVQQAKKNIEIEKQEMMQEIKVMAAELVVKALEKIIDEKVDDRKDKEMILRSVKGIKV